MIAAESEEEDVAAVLDATKQLRAVTLSSEDFLRGQVYDGVRVVNPFRELAERDRHDGSGQGP
jgi:hypothetical protein